MSRNPDLYHIAREITDSVFEPVTLQIGNYYLHPEDGVIQITEGCYRDPIYHRISNFWYWRVVETGEEKHGYGANWENVTMNRKEEYVISKQAVKAVAETGTKISLQDARKKINAFLPLLETKVTYGPQK